MDIRVNPKSALEMIDKCIVSGYQRKDAVAEDFAENGEKVTDGLLQRWRDLKDVWIAGTINGLASIFVSETPLYNFRDAHPPFGATSLDVRYVGIIRDFEAKIGKLNEYYKFIQSNFNVKPLQVTISGDQSRVNINSTDRSTNIIDQSIQNDLEQLERIIDGGYNYEDRDDVVGQIQEVKKLAEDPKGNRNKILSILGIILSRTSEIGTIGPLIAKMLGYFSNQT